MSKLIQNRTKQAPVFGVLLLLAGPWFVQFGKLQAQASRISKEIM